MQSMLYLRGKKKGKLKIYLTLEKRNTEKRKQKAKQLVTENCVDPTQEIIYNDYC